MQDFQVILSDISQEIRAAGDIVSNNQKLSDSAIANLNKRCVELEELRVGFDGYIDIIACLKEDIRRVIRDNFLPL